MNIKELKYVLFAIALFGGIALMGVFAFQYTKINSAVETVSESVQVQDKASETAYNTEQPLDKLTEYLYKEMPDMPYSCAEVYISLDGMEAAQESWQLPKLKGLAYIEWSVPETDGDFIKKAQELMKKPDETDYEKWLYFKYKLREDIFGMDVYDYITGFYDDDGDSIDIITGGGGTSYRFSKSGYMEAVVKDGFIYALLCMEESGMLLGNDMQQDNVLLYDFSTQIQENGDFYSVSGWFMDEENLYWTDHYTRYTELENPSRSFAEIRGREDEDWDDIMECFAAVKEADYRVKLTEGGSDLQIHFELLGTEPQKEFSATLWNGSCSEESYIMTVKDIESGQTIQSQEVDLCVEKTDTVIFDDFNGDGCLDMQIELPTHWNGEGAVMDKYADCYYMIWSKEEGGFVRTKKLEAVSGGAAHDGDIWIVEKGDCLWNIAKEAYGDGVMYTEIYENNRDVIGDDPRLILEGMELKLP